jgi:signal transduction histidine kinase/CheY-like chemotaxis protein
MLTTKRSTRAFVMPILGFALLFTCAGSGLWLSFRQGAAVDLLRRTLEVENRLNLVQRLASDAETAQRGYLLSGNKAYLQPYGDAVRRLPFELHALDDTIADPQERAALSRLRPAMQEKMDELGETISLARVGRRDDALRILKLDVGRQRMVEVRSTIEAMIARQNVLLSSRSGTVWWTSWLARAVLLLSAIFILALGVVTVRDGRRRLRTLEQVNRELREESKDRQAAQTQVRQLQKMEAVGQLTGGIAHDFNNMLAIVIGSLDLARRRLTGAEDRRLSECIDHATQGAQRAATLTARLLAFARQQPLDPKVIDANKLVGGMSEMLRRTLGASISIETVLAGGLWKICADPAQVENAIVNLAVNARDAMPDGGKLTIETANADLDERYARTHDEVTAGQYVMLSLTDTGCGMPSDVIERAFDPFYTTKAIGRGTGLGLSQIFGFVKQSRGHVKIYSEVGRGTTVKLYLPRYRGEDAQVTTDRADQPVTGGRPDEIVLVVEDEAQVRHMSVDALRELGYTVLQAANGEEALRQLGGVSEIDLLFTDIVMPGMTGRQLADRALRERPDLKILYTTGYTRNAIVHNGIVDEGVSFLTKPFTLDALARKIREVLDGKG